MKKRILSLLLVLVMVFSLFPTALAVESGFVTGDTAPETVSAQGPLSLPQGNLPTELNQSASGLAPAGTDAGEPAADDGVTGLTEPASQRFSETEGARLYADDDLVTFIVVTKDEPLLDHYTVQEIAGQTASVASYEQKQLSTLDSIKADLQAAFGGEEGFELGYTYTVATTGLSVTTAYGNKARIEAMHGVDYVYVAPTFSLPEDGMDQSVAEPLTNNATTMIGGNVLNASGYTGKGMRIAILDTGIKVDHPSFAALSEDQLEDPITRESVDAIWDSLKASQRTTGLNKSYYSTKIPYIFNYDRGDFNVDNTYAGSDHGLHVAGIAAANVLESTNVVGVAPEAQLLVMQVFMPGGGADWDTVLAALEDCVTLEVDSINLSLGAAAGFTDPAGNNMLEVMKRIQDSDIQLVIAAGNDTNSAVEVLTGLNMFPVDDPDNGLVGTPSTFSAALSVASVDNDGTDSLYFTVNGQDISYTDTAATSATQFIRNFQGKTLELVVVPGYGEAEDYEGLDVSGKVALISRGVISFPEKQSTAQDQGAVACVIYNNTKGSLLMQINDGNGNIPCVSISQADGAWLKAQAENGIVSLTVCDADLKHFTTDRVMSSFTSWGVTPDLKLKPEISGVGGNIYSCVHPAISGSYYGTMSGTSMATPQITGAMAVLIQYLDENYPELTGAAQRRAAANLLMSTAVPVLFSEDLEYSPRVQGAGLADLVAATATPVYFSNPNASETRPKAELGDDPLKTGKYSFDFTVTNMSDEDLVYSFTSSIMTESIFAGGYIANEPYALEARVLVEGFEAGTKTFLKYDFNDDGEITTADARVLLRYIAGHAEISDEHLPYVDINRDNQVNQADARIITDYCADLSVSVDMLDEAQTRYDVNTILVPAGETIELMASLELTENDRAYLEQFPNGIYVEGFLYAEPVEAVTEDGAVGPRLVMPILGFYGDWSDAPIFDSAEDEEACLYPLSIYTEYAQLGTNPYIRSGKSGDEYNAFSYVNPLAEIDVGLYRNVKTMRFTAADVETGEVYYDISGHYITKSFYYSAYGMIIPFYVLRDEGEVWDGTDAQGNKLPDGTKVTYTAEAWLDDGDEIMDDSFTFQVTLDAKAPEVLNKDELQESLHSENGRTTLTLNLLDNQHIAAVIFVSSDGVIMGKFEVDNTPGVAEDFSFDVTGFGTEFTIVVGDYACNEAEIDAVLNPTGHHLDKGTRTELDSGRLYGCETYDVAAIEPGWFSVSIDDYSDARNETFDSTNRYYAAEYVNGYVVAQSAVSGDLVLVTPSGTYWSQQTLVEQSGKVGDSGFWVLYDMALDYSATGSEIYDQWGSCYGTDTLYAVGWSYAGDNDNDGSDDGYNALFRIWVSKWSGDVYVDECARITGTDDGAEILTLGCTTEGQLYGIDTNGKLYSIDPAYYYDETVGTYGDNVVECTYIGTTDFVNELNYSGVNVIQSMGYDHNTDTMYWYAHSQTAAGYYYINVCMTYSVDLETADCTEVGTYGPSGQTCLFVPTDLESDLFTMGVNPERFSINPYQMTMVEGQVKKLNIDWTPWNAAPGAVEWSSSDESLATVDQYGFVTALASGEVTITAKGQVWDKWAGEWDPNTYTYSGAWVDRSVTCTITIVASEPAIYGYIISDFKNADNDFSWVTYSDQTPGTVHQISKPVTTPELGEAGPAIWQGGAYCNGYVYTTQMELVEGEGMSEAATVLYRSEVTKGETPQETIIGEPQRVGYTPGVEVGNMGFDYNTGRMYCVDLTNGGLAIIDLDSGSVDQLGTFSGDIGGAAIAPAMCVTADGTIVISNMFGTLYSVDADTLSTTRLGSIGTDTWYYAGMTYDHNTGSIYWNPCMSANASSLYLVRLEQDPWDESRTVANIMKMGNVSTKAGVEQTAMFTIPDVEPETHHIPVESITILEGESISGLVGGTARLTTATEPARPTISTRTWSSSDEAVVKVDRNGVLTYTGVGTATVTVSITNKDEAAHGGPFTDSIAVTVYEAAGRMEAFLTSDYGGSSYYDFWLQVDDCDVQHASLGETSINVYSLRVGTYYDGYFYGYNENSQFMRIRADQHSSYAYLGTSGLNTESQQVTGMAVDYSTGTMYALTRDAYGVKGALCTVNLDNGSLTKVADLSEYVFALAADAEGNLYAAGAPGAYSDGALYTVDKTDGTCTKVLDLPGSRIWTGEVYYGTQQYNPAMTYDFGTNRLYLNATSDPMYGDPINTGVYMIQLGGEEGPLAINLGKLCVQTRAGSAVKEGDATLGMLASIPEADQVPVGRVNGIILNKTATRVAVDGTTVLTASVRPSNAADTSVIWSSDNEAVATVADGVVTGVAAGIAVITVTSVENPAASASCTVTVIDLDGEQSVAYTASALTDSLYSFNPALPAQTAEVVGDFSGGSNIKGMAAGDGCIYYVIDDNFTFRLYRYDLLTKQTSSLGILEAWTGIQDIAYDPVNDLLYGVGGFYVYQYKDVSKMDGSYNSMSGYLYAMITLSGVACDDEGTVYFVGNDWGTVVLNKTDKWLYNNETLARDLALSIVPGQTEMAYDSSAGLFYITDASSNIYTLAMDGTVKPVDILGDGIDINGLAIFPAKVSGTDQVPETEE